MQGWLDYWTAEWVYKSPSAAQQSCGQNQHPSVPKEMDEIRQRAKEGRKVHSTDTEKVKEKINTLEGQRDRSK